MEVPAALEDELRSVAAQVADLADELERLIEAAAGENLDDEHDPDGSTVAFERARVTGLLAYASARGAELQRAVARLASGEYGVCEVCAGPIPPERLAAVPGTTTCVACAVAAGPERGLRRLRRD